MVQALGGGTPKKFWRVYVAPVFENLVESIPLAKDHSLIMSPFLQDFKEF